MVRRHRRATHVASPHKTPIGRIRLLSATRWGRVFRRFAARNARSDDGLRNFTLNINNLKKNRQFKLVLIRHLELVLAQHLKLVIMQHLRLALAPCRRQMKN
jgi:hypothetical protein